MTLHSLRPHCNHKATVRPRKRYSIPPVIFSVLWIFFHYCIYLFSVLFSWSFWCAFFGFWISPFSVLFTRWIHRRVGGVRRRNFLLALFFSNFSPLADRFRAFLCILVATVNRNWTVRLFWMDSVFLSLLFSSFGRRPDSTGFGVADGRCIRLFVDGLGVHSFSFFWLVS